MKRNFFSICLLCFASGGFIACQNQKEKSKGDEIEIHRYEKALAKISLDSIPEGLSAIQFEFPIFMGDANMQDSAVILQIANYLTDPLVLESYAKIEKLYGEGADLKKSLGLLFARFHEYFPNQKVPRVYTYISNFDYENRVATADSCLMISLDMYLGESEPNYGAVGLPRYICRRLTPEYIEIDVAKLLSEKVVPPFARKNLLDEMVSAGKLLYVTELLLPNVSVDKLIGYTPEQWKWCKEYEQALWNYLIQEKLLYEGDYFKLKHLLAEGPGNLPFEGAPPRLAEWIGWQITKRYIDKNKDLKSLLSKTDAQSILQGSGYKGK